MKPIGECTVLISGGEKGLGAAFKLELEKLGAKVYTTSSSSSSALHWDLRSSESTAALIKELSEKNIEVDIFIHCAHIFSDKKLILQVKAEDFKNSLVSNVVPVYELTRYLCRNMSRKSFGKVLFIGSLISQYGGAGKVAYITEKAALTGLTMAFHAEFSPKNVSVNIIHPNLFRTADIEERVPAEIIEKIKAASPTGDLLTIKDVLLAAFPFVDPTSTLSGESLLFDGGVSW